MPMSMVNCNWLSWRRLGLTFLICCHVIICCVSLYYVAHFSYRGLAEAKLFHILYDPGQLYRAIFAIALFSLLSVLFVFARFSFGYFCGFYFYTMVVGYLWLNCFSDLKYDHQFAGFSAAASAIAFLFPALLISSPVPQIYALSPRGLDNLLCFILLLSVATIIAGASYNFRVVSVAPSYEFANSLETPTILNYLAGK